MVIDEYWMHFPHIPTSGCEGVLIVLRGFLGPEVVLIDGHKSQVAVIQDIIAKAPDATVRWVVTHFHRDHIEDGAELVLLDEIKERLVRVVLPDPTVAFWPDDNKRVVEARAQIEVWRGARFDPDQQQLVRYLSPNDDPSWVTDSSGFRIGVVGMPGIAAGTKISNPNHLSLIVVGIPSLPRIDPPFSFLAPGDAEGIAWVSFRAVAQRRYSGIWDALIPLAILKMGHHGAELANPEDVLAELFGARVDNRLAVRVRNRAGPPAGTQIGGEGVLDRLSVRLHDTRDDGSLWVHVHEASGLTPASSPEGVLW